MILNMNLCVIDGKVINEIDLKFIYNSKNKSLYKKHVSIVKIELELNNKQIIKVHAYDEIADWAYRNLKQNDIVLLQGKLRNNYMEVEFIEILFSNL